MSMVVLLYGRYNILVTTYSINLNWRKTTFSTLSRNMDCKRLLFVKLMHGNSIYFFRERSTAKSTSGLREALKRIRFLLKRPYLAWWSSDRAVLRSIFILSGELSFSSSRSIFLKNNIKTPVQLIFNRPMFSDGVGKFVDIRQRSDKISGILALCFILNGFWTHHTECFQIRPFAALFKPANFSGKIVFSRFDPSVSFFGSDSFLAVGLKIKEIVLGIFEKCWLVFLESNAIIGFAFGYFLYYFFLTAHSYLRKQLDKSFP